MRLPVDTPCWAHRRPPVFLHLHRVERYFHIAVAGSSRIASLPDVKSAAEQGFPEVTIGFWIGLSGRPDLPQNVVDTILAAARKVKENENFLADLGKLGLVLDYAETTQMKNDILDESKSVKELQLFGQGM